MGWRRNAHVDQGQDSENPVGKVRKRLRLLPQGAGGGRQQFQRRVTGRRRVPDDGEKPSAVRGHLGVARDELDKWDNLVELCRVHHKLVDDQPMTYPVDACAMKAEHERLVKETLARRPAGKQPHFALLFRVHTGCRDVNKRSHNRIASSLDHIGVLHARMRVLVLEERKEQVR